MALEPEKFYIGVVDLFSTLLPGAALTYLWMPQFIALLGDGRAPMSPAEGWTLFLFAAYLLGHFIFLAGSYLDSLYDRIRRATNVQQVVRLAEGKSDVSAPLLRRLSRWLGIKAGSDRAVFAAVRLKNAHLGVNRDALNAFQWCRARLMLEHPAAFAAVQRFEADSKFFRSLLVVLVLLMPLALVDHTRWPLALVSLLLIVPAFSRYFDQRLKATDQAYWLAITLGAEGTKVAEHRSSTTTWTHAGGIVMQRNRDGTKFLLVRAKSGAVEWVLPKGHIEAHELPREAAVREVREEAGVWARVVREVGGLQFTNNGTDVHAIIYLMEHLATEGPHEDREQAWLTFSQVLEKVKPETRDLLTKAIPAGDQADTAR